jgi:hypothetical protein
MVNRVLFDANVLKISKPGVNVLTANPWDLQFNSDASGMDKYISGSASIPSGNGDFFINYGTTFAKFPLVFLRLRMRVKTNFTGSEYKDVMATGAGYAEIFWSIPFDEGSSDDYILAAAQKNRIAIERQQSLTASIDYLVMNYTYA